MIDTGIDGRRTMLQAEIPKYGIAEQRIDRDIAVDTVRQIGSTGVGDVSGKIEIGRFIRIGTENISD